MRRIVIYKDEVVGDKKQRVTLRAIMPTFEWKGYTTTGKVIDSEAKNLAKALEPSMTGYYLA
jgi:hypothetical protein